MNPDDVEESVHQVRAAIDLLNAHKEDDEEVIKKAEKALRNALKLDQSNPITWYNLAVLLTKTSRKQEGVELFKQALRLKPDFEDAWVNFALADLSDFNIALSRLKEGVRLCPWSAIIWNALGSFLAGMDQTKEAEMAYLSATEADPKYEPAWRNLASIYSQTGRKEKAKSILHKAYSGQIFPTLKEMEERHEDLQRFSEMLLRQSGIKYPRSSFIDSEASSTHGAMILNAMYLMPQNEDSLRTKLSRHPSLPWLWLELGEWHLKLGKYVDAEKSIRRAIRLGSKDRRKQLILAQALHASGKLDEAFSEISKAVETDKTSWESWRIMAEISEALGRTKEAKNARNNLSEFEPRF